MCGLIWCTKFGVILMSFDYRSIGLHREAEMIEQQLKLKQGTGQMPMNPGKST